MIYTFIHICIYTIHIYVCIHIYAVRRTYGMVYRYTGRGYASMCSFYVGMREHKLGDVPLHTRKPKHSHTTCVYINVLTCVYV